MTQRRHGTAVAIGGRAVLLLGPSGTGKSDLALRLVDRGAVLVADDQLLLAAEGGTLFCRAPEGFSGRMEVRGLGIVKLEAVAAARVALAVELGAGGERLPPPSTVEIDGISIARIRLDPRAPAAPILVELAFNGAVEPIE